MSDDTTATAMVDEVGERRERRGLGSAIRASLSALVSPLVSRERFAGDVGLTFNGKRDLTRALGYQETLGPEDYRRRYERGGIAERIIEAYPNATWPSGSLVYEDESPETTTAFEKQVTELFNRLSLWSRLQRADILSGLGRYSVILIGAPGELAEELPRLGGPESVLYFTALGEKRARISRLVTNSADPRFGLPEVYTLSLGSDINISTQSAFGSRIGGQAIDSKTAITAQVHWSRIIHVCEGLLEDDMYGKPRLRSVWNYLDDLDKIVGGGAEAAWKRMDPGLHVNVDPRFEPAPGSLTALSNEVDEYVHDLRRVIRTTGTAVTPLSANVSEFGGNAGTIIELISAATGIPQRILTGSERGELASSQDQENWSDRIAERRGKFAEPLIKALIDRLIAHGALVAPASYAIEWPDAEELNELQKGTLLQTIASANSAQSMSGDTPVMTSNEMREKYLGLEPIEEEDLPETPTREDDPAADDGDEDTNTDKGDDEDKGAVPPELRANAARPSAIRRAGERHVRPVMSVLITIWAAAAAQATNRDFIHAVRHNNPTYAEQLVNNAITKANKRLQEELPAELLGALVSGGEAELKQVKARKRWLSKSTNDSASATLVSLFSASFDKTNSRATSWAEVKAGELITEINEETRLGIRQMIADAFKNGVPPAQIARQIKVGLGLRSDQARALDRYRQEGATAKQLEKYAAKLRKDRAVLIARTETAKAANQGQRELWMQGIESGNLPSDAKRKWIGTDDGRERPEHVALNDVIVGINEPFPGGIEPGEEPNCRCSQGLVDPDEEATSKKMDEVQREADAALNQQLTQEQLDESAAIGEEMSEAEPDDTDTSEWIMSDSQIRVESNITDEPQRQSKLQQNEINALNRYTGAGYNTMNGYLYKGENAVGSITEKTAEQIAIINRLAETPLSQDTVVWRGVGRNDATEKLFDSLQPGAEIQLNGIQSTSADPFVSMNFTSGDKRGGFLFEIKTRKGLWIDQEFTEERELILAHGQRYRVVGVKEIPFLRKRDYDNYVGQQYSEEVMMNLSFKRTVIQLEML